MAVEMTVAGVTRGEVGRRLQDEFGIGDPETILDQVFVAGGGAARRARRPPVRLSA